MFDYEVVRSNRKTMVITVNCLNSVTVRVPYGVGQDKINAFVRSHASWVERHLAQNGAVLTANADVLNYKKIYICGELYNLCVLPKTTPKTRTCAIEDGTLKVTSLIKIKDALEAHLSQKFLLRFEYFSKKTGLSATFCGFKRYKSRWGCCGKGGKITFNFRLLMLNEGVWDYLIVHELAHVEHFDHSPAFWALVKNILPDYEGARKMLDEFAFLSRLY